MANREVEFNQDYRVKDEEGKKYYKGKKYSMSEASANHFFKRGLAEKIDTADEKKARKAADDAARIAKEAAQLAADVTDAAKTSKDANLTVIDAENALENADDADKKGAEAYLKETKKAAAEASKNLKALEK
jgi:hypothetical protein